MKRLIIYLAAFVICALNSLILAQDVAIQTTESFSSLELRIPDKERIEEFQNNKDFQYESAPPIEMPIWLQKLLANILRTFEKSTNVAFSREIGLIMLILVISTIIIMIALRMQGVSLKSLFGKKKLETEDADFIAEDVNKMDFEQLINESLKAKNYRLVIRFLYLKNLKLLSDREFINWNPNKTNYSYLNEIESPGLRTKFLRTTHIFDFVWYGEFILDENSFNDAYNFFLEFNQLIGNER